MAACAERRTVAEAGVHAERRARGGKGETVG